MRASPAAAPSASGEEELPDVAQSVNSFRIGRPDRQERLFKVGDVVCITHLKSHCELNWRLGRVVLAPEELASRVGVRLLDDTNTSSTPYSIRPINLFTIPKDIDAKMLANLVDSSAFGTECVSIDDAKLLIKAFDFKYTPPWEQAVAPAVAKQPERSSASWQYPDGTVRTFEYTDTMTSIELVKKVFEETTKHASVMSGVAPPTAPERAADKQNEF